MKRGVIINANLAGAIGRLGHTDLVAARLGVTTALEWVRFRLGEPEAREITPEGSGGPQRGTERRWWEFWR
jgi:hypothetical protein